MPDSLRARAFDEQPGSLGLRRVNRRITHPPFAATRGNSAPVAGRTPPERAQDPIASQKGPLIWAVGIFLVLQLGSGTFVIPDDSSANVIRVAGLLVLTPLALRSKTANPPLNTSNQVFLANHLTVFRRFLVGYALWAVSGTLLHGYFGQFITHIVGAILLLLVVRVLASDGGETVMRVLPWILGLAMALSVGMGLLDPNQGLAGGRLRGVFTNANLLGFYAFLTVVTGLLFVRIRFWSLALCASALFVIVWTGSRTSMIAALAAIGLLALFGNRRSRLLVVVIIGVAGVTLAGLIDPSASSLLRDFDTRDGSLEEAVRVLSISPLIGVGVGGSLVEVASSPLRALAEGGIIALIGVVIMYTALFREAIRSNAWLLAVTSAAIVTSFGEGWFLSALGPMMLLFTAAWIGASSRARRVEYLDRRRDVRSRASSRSRGRLAAQSESRIDG